jgi:hypothetical protein
MMVRRHFAAVLAGTLGLDGCDEPPRPDTQHVAGYIQAIITGLVSALQQVRLLLSDGDRQSLHTLLADLQASHAMLEQAASQAQAQAVVQQILSDLASFLALLPNYGLPPTVGADVAQITAAVQVLIPVIAAAVGLAAVSRVTPKMTEDEAIEVLTRRY